MFIKLKPFVHKSLGKQCTLLKDKTVYTLSTQALYYGLAIYDNKKRISKFHIYGIVDFDEKIVSLKKQTVVYKDKKTFLYLTNSKRSRKKLIDAFDKLQCIIVYNTDGRQLNKNANKAYVLNGNSQLGQRHDINKLVQLLTLMSAESTFFNIELLQFLVEVVVLKNLF